MKEAHRQLIFEALIGNDAAAKDLRPILEPIAAEHTAALEPIIDKIIQECLNEQSHTTKENDQDATTNRKSA